MKDHFIILFKKIYEVIVNYFFNKIKKIIINNFPFIKHKQDNLCRNKDNAYPLIKILQVDKQKKIYVEKIIYRWSINRNGDLIINVVLNNIYRIVCDDKTYEIYILEHNFNNIKKVEIQYDNTIRSFDSCKKRGKYIVYTFDGNINKYIDNQGKPPAEINISIVLSAAAITDNCNLCFMPLNYVYSTNCIKIFSNGKNICYYKKNKNKYDNYEIDEGKVDKPHIYEKSEATYYVFYILDIKD
ncbi:MAG: hypothetical protein IKJ73_03170 [Lachnospiraceae bacterium]|nr:hypothetical protein [Lachnospiraceae bacterium]